MTGFLQRLHTRGISPRPELKPIKKAVIVEPLFDPVDQPMPGSTLIIPASSQDIQSKQGYVVSAGPDADYAYPDHILFKPFMAEGFKIDGIRFLQVPDRHIAAKVVDGKLIPRRGDVLILPDFKEFDQKYGSLYLPPQTARNVLVPPTFGVVVEVGEDTTLEIGTRVLFPPKGGFEIPFFDDNRKLMNHYLMPEDLVLGTVETLSS